MARNSITGRFRDIEIAFSVDADCIRMNLQNLVVDRKQVRLMYQKQPSSGLANWKQFELIDEPVTFRLPVEVLEAYRLTFFVDDAEPISARIENILTELEMLSSESPPEDLPEKTEAVTEIEAVTNTESVDTPHKVEAQISKEPEGAAAKSIETDLDLTEIQRSTNPPSTVNAHVSEEPEAVAVSSKETIPHLSEIQHPKQEPRQYPEDQQEVDAQRVPSGTVARSSMQTIGSRLPSLGSHLEFRVSVSTLPPSALSKQKEARVKETIGNTTPDVRRKSKQKESGFFGQIVRTLKGEKHGKAYYQSRGESIQDEFQDQLSKLEKDYNEGYGLNLLSWKPETLSEEETAIFLLNLMVNEIIAWQKEVGRSTPETEGIVETLVEVDALLRQTLKQTRGISAPAPTLFPNLLAENERDLEKIRSECDAYLCRFTSKLIRQEKDHAAKIEILSFRKFLTEFVRDFLFAEIARSTPGNALSDRLNWFLELVDSKVMPIEIGKTKVSPSHHKVKDARPSECEPGTIVEVITPGLQSKDGKRVSQMAVVIEAE